MQGGAPSRATPALECRESRTEACVDSARCEPTTLMKTTRRRRTRFTGGRITTARSLRSPSQHEKEAAARNGRRSRRGLQGDFRLHSTATRRRNTSICYVFDRTQKGRALQPAHLRAARIVDTRVHRKDDRMGSVRAANVVGKGHIPLRYPGRSDLDSVMEFFALMKKYKCITIFTHTLCTDASGCMVPRVTHPLVPGTADVHVGRN